MQNTALPTTIEGLGIKLVDLCGVVSEIKEDGKKTLAQAQATNGRVTKVEGAIESLDKRLKELENNKKTLIDSILRLLMAAFGAQTIFGQLTDFLKHFF